MDNFNILLQCTVCRETKTNPRDSQCCHKLFCLDCIQSLERQSICPICRIKTSFIENPWASRLIDERLNEKNYSQSIPRQNFSWLFFNSVNNDSSTIDSNTDAFKVIVLTLEDRKINVYVEKSDTIKILKLKIQRSDGILFCFIFYDEKKEHSF